MRNTILFAFTFASIEAFAGVGPTSIGSISMGMSKSEYVSAIGITPNICEGRNKKDLKYLQPDSKVLCGFDISAMFKGNLETIQVGNLSYDVISTEAAASKFVDNIGSSIMAIFLEDRLISIDISSPRISIGILTAKYGAPRLDYNVKPKTCNNVSSNIKDGSIFNAVWVNGEVTTTYKNGYWYSCKTAFQQSTRYIIEATNKIALIEDAIDKYQKENYIKSIKETPF